jgi:hypothetical protein
MWFRYENIYLWFEKISSMPSCIDHSPI